MSKHNCLFCLVIISYLKMLNTANIPLRPSIPSTSTYKPSTLLLPPGFDSQKVPRQPMLYPYAGSSAGISMKPQLKNLLSTTPGWIPVALKVKNDLYTTTPTHAVAVLEDLISNDQPKYSSPSYKEGPVFESIVYGTWKPDPPVQPVKTLKATEQPTYNSSNTSGSNMNGDRPLVGDRRVYNKTINSQHGGFIRNIQQLSKTDGRIVLSSTSTPVEYKSKDFLEISSELKLQRKIKKHGRRRIRPITSTTEPNAMEKSSNGEETTTTTTTTTATQENIQHQQNVINVNSTDPKLAEVAKQINESNEIKYNHKQSSTHSIDMMTTAVANNDDEYDDNDEVGVSNNMWRTKSKEFFSTLPEADYGDDDDDAAADIFENATATRRSWPTDFMEEPLTTTFVNDRLMNKSHEFQFNNSLEADPLEIPLALSALNIPYSLWPKLPGNITKLGKPYEAESSAEEAALCVPITVREQNMMSSRELVYIERVFCFPMPPSTTITENDVTNLESTFTSSTTFKTVTIAEVKSFNDFIDSNSRVSNASSIFKNQLYLLTSILFIYFNFII